jgi:perosamine synthetase
MEIQLFNTYIHPSAYRRVKEVLDSTFLSEGKVVKEFEDNLIRTLKWPNAVALNSGTSALHLALILAGIGSGDEVILPAQTFIATGMAVLHQGATPVFADVQYETGNIDIVSLEKKITSKTKAIIAVHWLGYPCHMDGVLAVAKKHNLIVIEDAAHAIGATYHGKPIGTLSDITCFSFQAIKHLATGDGGAICTLDPALAEEGRRLRWFGIDRQRDQASWGFDRVFNIPTIGYKYHMNNYAAALGLANLETLPERLVRRRANAARYQAAFASVSGLKPFAYAPDRESSWFTFGAHIEKREDFVKAMRDRKVPVTNVNFRIDRNEVFGGIRQDLGNQARFDQTQTNLPVHDGLSDEQVEYIIDSVKKGW